MNDHSIFIGCSAYIDTAIISLGVVDIKTILPQCGASLREGGWGRSGPFNLRGWVTQ